MTNFNHTERIMQLQSNHSDCHERLGRRGCLSGIPGRDQEWYSAAIQLPAGQESEYTSVSGYKDLLLERLGSAFKWMDSQDCSAGPEHQCSGRLHPGQLWR